MTELNRLIDAIAATGLPPPEPHQLEVAINKDRPVRWSTNGKKHDVAGFCFVREIDGILVASFGCMRSDIRKNWSSKTRNDMPEVDWQAHLKRREAVFKELQEDVEFKASKAAITAQERWKNAKPADSSQPYLMAKRVQPHGLRVEGENLLIPCYRIDDETEKPLISTIQTIFPNGKKRLLKDGIKKGGFYEITSKESPKDLLILCEGFATGASIFEATGISTVVCFDAGNLLSVANAIQAKFPSLKFIVAADDDHLTDGNPGLTNAREAARAVEGLLAVPLFPAERPAKATDFNDLSNLVGIDAVRLQIESASLVDPNAWEEPQPLIAKVENDAYPIHALPELIKLAVEEAASFTQSPISMLASSALTVVSLALQGHYNIRRAEKLVAPLALYFLIIAESGERKTAGDKLFTQGIEDFVNEQMELAKPELQKYRADLQIWEAKHSGIKAKIQQLARERKQTTAEENSLYDLETSKPQPPKIPKLLLKDISPEKLGLSLAVDWPVAGIVTSEAGVFFGSHAMSKDVVMRTLSLLNVLWDGGSISSERKVAEGFNIRSARLTMGLAIQEGTLREAFTRTGPLLRDTGFLARNLLCWPTSNMGNRPFKEAPKKWPHLEAFNARIRAFLNAPLPLNNGVLEPVEIGLSDSAKQDWVEYHDAVESQLKASGDYFEIKDVAAKSADNVARLAGLFEKFNPNGGTSISQDSLQRAAQICAWHLEEARRFLGELVLPQDLSDAFRLEKWLVIYSMDKKTVSQRDAQNAGPVRDKKRLDVALAELESLSRIRTVQEGKRKLIKLNPMVMQ